MASTQSWVFFYWKAEQKNSTIHKKKKGLFLLYKPCNRLEISLRKTPIKSVIPFKIQKFTTPHYHIMTSWFHKFPLLYDFTTSRFTNSLSHLESRILHLGSHISHLESSRLHNFTILQLTSHLSALDSHLSALNFEKPHSNQYRN